MYEHGYAFQDIIIIKNKIFIRIHIFKINLSVKNISR